MGSEQVSWRYGFFNRKLIVLQGIAAENHGSFIILLIGKCLVVIMT